MVICFHLHIRLSFQLPPILGYPGRRHCIVAYEPHRKFRLLHLSRSWARIVRQRYVVDYPINHKYAVRDLGEDIILQLIQPGRSVHFFVVVARTLFLDKREARPCSKPVSREPTWAMIIRPLFPDGLSNIERRLPSFQLQ